MRLRDDPYSVRRMEKEFKEIINNPNRETSMPESKIINKKPLGYD